MDLLKSCILTLLVLLPALLFAGETININTADKEVLMSIKGVGEKRAEDIIEYRKQFGPFKSIDELAEIKGIGRAFIDANRDTLAVTDER